jgi:dUTP pyrophosphatase
MEVKIKKYNEAARIPEKAYDKDFCYDVYAVSEEEVAPNVWKYGLGFGLQIERGMETITKCVHPYSAFPEFALDFNRSPLNLSIDIRPRSSVWKTGMVLSNCEGTGDEGYTNEYSAVFYHLMPNMPRYKVGDKIAQLKIGITFPIIFKEVEEFEETERGMRGYGSSDNKK